MLSLRIATEKEFKQLILIEKEILDEDIKQMSKEYYQHRVSLLDPKLFFSEMKKKENLFLVALKDNNIVAVARGFETKDDQFSLEFIGLKKQFRKQGIAPKLLYEVERNVKKAIFPRLL